MAEGVHSVGFAARVPHPHPHAASAPATAAGRSHELLQLSVSWVETKGKSFGILNLVDLAGSEGMKKTGATGQNAKEGCAAAATTTATATALVCVRANKAGRMVCGRCVGIQR